MIGRDDEFAELQEYLDQAAQGRGNTLFVSGEAGIGKTRMVEELTRLARSKGFEVLVGNSTYESLTPYMPFLETLRSGGLEHLFAEEAPRVEAIFLVTRGGLLIKEVKRKESDLNPDIFTSMLAAVGNFVRESLSTLNLGTEEGTLNTLGYENCRILVESGSSFDLVVIVTGRENEFLIEDMREVSRDVIEKYGSALEKWDGKDASVKGVEGLLSPLITSGKYDGVFYGKEDPKTKRNLLFENISLGLVRHAQSAPTLMCLEDVQWADPSSLALMHYVARNARECGLLVLGTYRPEEVAVTDGMGHPLRSTMQLMDREDLCRTVDLHRLPQETIDHLLSAILGQIDLDEEFVGRIYRETEGNPLFMIQLVKLLVDEEIIGKDNGTWRLTGDLDEALIPSKIHNVIARRLDRVEAEARKVLDYASVVGQTFASTVLADALHLERVQLLERLRSLEKTHTLIHSLNGMFRFDHSKIKEVLYDEIPTELRMEYHSIVANSIEQLNKGNLDEVIGDLAFHYYQCKNGEKALHFLLKAAENAKTEYSNEEAIRFYTQALELEEDKKRRMEILEALGDIQGLTGEYDAAMDSYKGALELADDRRKKAELKAKMGHVMERKAEFDESIGLCSEALNLVEGEGCLEEGLALHNLASAHIQRGDYEEALKWETESLGIAEQTADQLSVAASLMNMGTAYGRLGELDKALEYLGKSLEVSENVQNLERIAACLQNKGIMHSDKGETEKALEHFRRSLEISEKIGNQFVVGASLNSMAIEYSRMWNRDLALECLEKGLKIKRRIGDQQGISVCLENIGVELKALGEYDRALDCYEEALKISEEIGDKMGVQSCHHNAGIVHVIRGEYDKAFGHLEKSLETSNEIDFKWGIATCLQGTGFAHMKNGEYDKALEHLKKSVDVMEKVGDAFELSRSYCGLAETYLREEDRVNSLKFCDKALALAKDAGMKDSIAWARRILGMIHSLEEGWDLAAEDFEKSIEIYGEIGLKKNLADSYYEYGLMWKKKGDDKRARANLNEALDVFAGLKLKNRVEEVNAAIESL